MCTLIMEKYLTYKDKLFLDISCVQIYSYTHVSRYLWFTELEQLLEINDMQKTGPIHRRLMDVQQLWCKSWCFQGLIVSVKHISWLFKLFTLLAAVSLISVKVSFW